MMPMRSAMSLVLLTLAGPTLAQSTGAGQTAVAAPSPKATDTPWPEAWFEIFKLAPGKQEAFIRRIAKADEVAAAGGQPPIQMFVHQDGADWDILLFKPVRDEHPTVAQQAAMDAKARALGIETGPAYFLAIREEIAAHTDTKTYGPLSAAQWLARLGHERRPR